PSAVILSAADAAKPAWKGEKSVWAALCSEWNESAGWKRYGGEVAAMRGTKKERADADAAVNRDGAVARHDGAMAMSDHDARKPAGHVGDGAHRRWR
ncbi:MAG: hypothetical protein ACKO54_18815, partial [Alphaproteobacteria bacterium]